MTKQEDTVRVRRLDDGTWIEELEDGTTIPMDPGETDWERVKAMTDEDAEYNALMDPDFEPFLTKVDREKITKLVDPKIIRKKLKLTQIEFAERFAIPLGTLRDWERRARFPDSAARAYLRVIAEDPESVANALKRSLDRVPVAAN